MALEPTPSTARETHFAVGAHVVRLSCAKGRWSVFVDQAATDQWYASEAEAWEAGVREADRLDRTARS